MIIEYSWVVKSNIFLFSTYSDLFFGIVGSNLGLLFQKSCDLKVKALFVFLLVNSDIGYLDVIIVKG